MLREPVQETDPTIGRLIADASRDISTLVSKQIELAKAELRVSVKAGGTGIALFAAAGFFGVLAVIMLSITIALFINWGGAGLAMHWAFLIVTVFWLLVAAILGLVGLKKVKQVKAPERSIHQAQELKSVLPKG